MHLWALATTFLICSGFSNHTTSHHGNTKQIAGEGTMGTWKHEANSRRRKMPFLSKFLTWPLTVTKFSGNPKFYSVSWEMRVHSMSAQCLSSLLKSRKYSWPKVHSDQNLRNPINPKFKDNAFWKSSRKLVVICHESTTIFVTCMTYLKIKTRL